MSPAIIIAALLSTLCAANGNPGDRLAAASERFLGAPYKLGPLGEGTQGEFDRDPLFRTDVFDCTTFVETSMAYAVDPKRAESVLQKIRYKNGEISYETRNHFTEADWIPNNINAGFVRDITKEVAGGNTHFATKTISKRAWYAAKSEKDLEGFSGSSSADLQALARKWRERGANMDDQPVSLPYLPIEALASALERIPNGTIASIVRADQADKPTLVSHQFLIVDKEGTKCMRHAAEGRQVMDVPILDYFERHTQGKWPIIGLNLLAPL